jgi:hypothetical protein
MTNEIKLDFQQARMKHIGFKSKLRSILFGSETNIEPVASEYECAVGKWIYGHALETYGNIPEMAELEKVHKDIHSTARELLALYQSGRQEEARQGLYRINEIADVLVHLLDVIEQKVK